MHSITDWNILRVLIILGLLFSSARGTESIEQAGWLIRPEQGMNGRVRKRCKKSTNQLRRGGMGGYWQRLGCTWHVPVLRSMLLWGLWQISGQVGMDGFQLLPWLLWLLPEQGEGWRWLKQGMWQVQRLVILGYLGIDLVVLVRQFWTGTTIPWLMGMGCVIGAGKGHSNGGGPQANVERQADGGYLVNLNGHFTLRVDGVSPFRIRLLMVFLGLLQSDNDERPSRRTRDGRTPLVRQEQLGSWFGVPQERISQYTQYWLKADWANLLSLKSAAVLTHDLLERIVSVLATFPNWHSQQVYQHLHQQGVKVTYAQVEQAAEQSGWRQLQATWLERYEMQEAIPHLREAGLLQQLLAQVQSLLTHLEAGHGLTPEEHWPLADLQALAETVGLQPQAPFAARPWMSQVEQVLFGQCDPARAAVIYCPACGSRQVKPKGKKPRWKKFYDQNGDVQEVAVYRYFCGNSHCATQSFTHFPAGLLPYSPYRTQVHPPTRRL